MSEHFLCPRGTALNKTESSFLWNIHGKRLLVIAETYSMFTEQEKRALTAVIDIQRTEVSAENRVLEEKGKRPEAT